MAAVWGMSTAVFWVIFCVFATTPGRTLEQDHFHEELLIKPFQTGHVYTQFKFTTLSNVSLTNGQSRKYMGKAAKFCSSFVSTQKY